MLSGLSIHTFDAFLRLEDICFIRFYEFIKKCKRFCHGFHIGEKLMTHVKRSFMTDADLFRGLFQ